MHDLSVARPRRGLVPGLFLAAGLIFPQLAAAAPGESTPAITVNGVAITNEAVEAEFRFIENPKKMFHPRTAEGEAASLLQAVDRVIVWELVRQKMDAAGKTVAERDVEAETTEDRLRIGDGFPRYIAMLGQDDAGYDKRKRNVMNFRKYIEEFVVPLQKVSEDEIKKRFEQADPHVRPESYRAEYLQVYSPDSSGPSGDAVAAAATRAHTLIREGATLADAGKAVTTAAVFTRIGGGVYQTGQGPIYEKAVLDLKPGKVGEIFVVSNASRLIPRLVERTPAKKLSLKEARPGIVTTLQNEKADQASLIAVQEMKKKAKIVYLDPRYAPPAE